MNIIELAKKHKWNMPTKCVECSCPLELNENHSRLFCTNPNCLSYKIGRIAKWVSVLDIKEFGDATIDTIARMGFVDISDLYKDDLYNRLKFVEGFGEKSVSKMKAQVEAHKEMSIEQFIAGYNIKGLGEKQIAKVIQENDIKDLATLFDMTASDFICEGIGDILAEKLEKGLEINKYDMLETLKFVGIKSKNKTCNEGALQGKSFCFTGAASMPRKVLQEMVINKGGIVFDSCKKGLDFLVMADPNSTSSKAQKARKDGITIISEQDFFEMAK